jgi:hypothetical protein
MAMRRFAVTPEYFPGLPPPPARSRQSNCFSKFIMPAKNVRDDGHSKKRIKLNATSRTAYHYSDGADIQRCLQIQDESGLVDGEVFATSRGKEA